MNDGVAAKVLNVSDTANARWRLHRAGIVNVYQYENEVLDFAGGRLLLRGVNGSGKSTAMNMLLPFLLTARPGRIDAAGEQRGILKSWMLSGRDDTQPIGYLWIEFKRLDEFLVCGCGIKANRNSDRVSTWWFVTSKRPGIDVSLVEQGVPLSASALRAALDDDKVFSERQRGDYRRTIESQLFHGASIDQHIGLIHVVRSPRVGDRIDRNLPVHLVDALPQLSEQALTDAAQPLDDLEEHRRNVADLKRTSDAIQGILNVYRSYCINELTRHTTEGRSCLSEWRRCVRNETSKKQTAEEAAAEVNRLDATIGNLSSEEQHLRSKISALEESDVYRDGRKLDALRDHVEELAKQRERAAGQVEDRTRLVDIAIGDLRKARQTSRNDLEKINAHLQEAKRLCASCRIDHKSLDLVVVNESTLADAGAIKSPDTTALDRSVSVTKPDGSFNVSGIERQIKATAGDVLLRRNDLRSAEAALGVLDTAIEQLSRAESRLEDASDAADRAKGRLTEQYKRLNAARDDWMEKIESWSSTVHPLLRDTGIHAPRTASLSGTTGVAGADLSGLAGAADSPPETVHADLLGEIDILAGYWRNEIAAVDHRLADERATAEDAQQHLDELLSQAEPDPPRLGWQSVDGQRLGGVDYCLADLIDFASHVDNAGDRAGLEAALESSGLLAARLAGDTTVELANGELVAIIAGGAPDPLSEHLTVTVPDRLIGHVNEGLVAKLFDSISCDMSSSAATVMTLDGEFRVGALCGRHHKERAEFIGATARRAALERARQESAVRLEQARSVVAHSESERAEYEASLQEVEQHKSLLPDTRTIVSTHAAVEAATDIVEQTDAAHSAAKERVSEAERASQHASDELHRSAATLHLPADRAGLDEIRRDLGDIEAGLKQCGSQLSLVKRSVDTWSDAADRWSIATGDLQDSQDYQVDVESRHSREQNRLTTIQDSIGVEYAQVITARDQCKTELQDIKVRLPETRTERDEAFQRQAALKAEASSATERRTQTEKACDEMRLQLLDVCSTSGFLSAITGDIDTASELIGTESAGPEGLKEILEATRPLLLNTTAAINATTGINEGTSHTTAAPISSVVHTAIHTDTTDADSVRQSLRQRRDSLGAGLDAEARRPDPRLPLVVEVTGRLGRAPLVDSLQKVSQQHRELAGLLDHKQDNALRELLQGLIAREIAEKVHGAERLVKLMNQHLNAISTAHQVGVRLRWQRFRELDPTTARMVGLLAKVPDLRTEDENHELRRALSNHLDEARAMQPDVPYRQIINETLDYKQWHEMSVMVRRAGSKGNKESKLSRNTPLSEGEKRFVTYLPLFAAVAASYDALAEQHSTSGTDQPGITRFVLLDDAFAKVSEDNHAALLGLLVELDLDLIATSERLWGTYNTVPELSIIEVIRDARLGAILLEKYRWDGTVLERLDTS
ncbi:MAG: TIGR02680 family protein [Acidimicrobiaceae bacterium]|nr:TIGR02680 family protein [Acidimicrobiaceae bacterium]